DQVYKRQRTLESDPLRANHLLGRGRKKCAGFHGCVVGDDHAWNAFDIADPRDNSGSGNLSPLVIHFVRRPEFDLKKRRVFVEQMMKPLAYWQTSPFTLTFVPGLASAFAQHGFLLRNCGAMRAQHFTRIRPSHMPKPRLICEWD